MQVQILLNPIFKLFFKFFFLKKAHLYRDFPVGNKLCKVPPLQTLFPTRKSLYKYAFLCFFLKKSFLINIIYYIYYYLIFSIYLLIKVTFTGKFLQKISFVRYPPYKHFFLQGFPCTNALFYAFQQKILLEKVGFEPTQENPIDLQSTAFNHSAIFPLIQIGKGIEPFF